ncbi:hypothetical protein [Leifsonia sp. EB34]|uniref:hypothetical protein n=1 Tax=Leifsonia sp. EB34 TaxID=3156303 RepID=UPI0035156C01
MRGLPKEAVEALGPLRRRIAADARAQAAALIASARSAADALVSEARERADAITRDARTSGEDTAASAAAEKTARVRREARGLLLNAAAAVRQHLRDDVDAAVEGLTDDPRYPAIRAALIERGRATLGSQAEVVDVPAGGVVLVDGACRLDLSLRTLAHQAFDAREHDLSARWTL